MSCHKVVSYASENVEMESAKKRRVLEQAHSYCHQENVLLVVGSDEQ